MEVPHTNDNDNVEPPSKVDPASDGGGDGGAEKMEPATESKEAEDGGMETTL